jgi:hypothetical protein
MPLSALCGFRPHSFAGPDREAAKAACAEFAEGAKSLLQLKLAELGEDEKTVVYLRPCTAPIGYIKDEYRFSGAYQAPEETGAEAEKLVSLLGTNSAALSARECLPLHGRRPPQHVVNGHFVTI